MARSSMPLASRAKKSALDLTLAPPARSNDARDPLGRTGGDLDVTVQRPARPPAAPSHRAGSSRPRRASTARPIAASDKALVERTTRVLSAIQLVEPGLPATRAADDDGKSSEVTLITGAKLASLRVTAAPPRAPRRIAPRTWHVAALMWLLALVLVAGGTFAVANAIGQRVTPRAFAPRGASLDTLPSDAQLADDWSTGTGVSNLDIGGGAGPGAAAPGSAGLPVKPTKPSTPVAKSTPPPAPSGIQAAPVQPWPPANAYMYVPGHPAFAVASSGGYYSWTFGQCTWWAQNERRDENLMHMGNAQYWAGVAASRGYKVGSIPAAKATAVFQPGVQGAGGAGHVAHVVAVYPDGWFLVSEMNFYWNGGGNARVDYRFAHSGPGVSFIY
jgi:hypothetical protein